MSGGPADLFPRLNRISCGSQDRFLNLHRPLQDNLLPWQPGQTGNPGGRPKKKPITDRYVRIVETELPDELIQILNR